MVSVCVPGASFDAGNSNRPRASLTTVTVIVDPGGRALTRTPSMAPSGPVICPLRATGDCAEQGALNATANTAETVNRKRRVRIGVLPGSYPLTLPAVR